MRHLRLPPPAGLRAAPRATSADVLCLLLLAVLASVCLAGLSGCAQPTQPQEVDSPEPSAVPEDEALRERLDDVLHFTYRHRHLNLNDHAAWQILHGVLVYKQDFLIQQDANSPEKFPAVAHIFNGGEMKGWTVRPGDIFTHAGGRRGLVAELEAGSNAGQGHYDQWLAVLAQCDLPPTTQIQLGRHTFTMDDFVNQVMWDVPNRRLDDGQWEYSWTLIGLSKYLPTDATWTARDGETWSLERLVQKEAEQAEENLAMGACGGTHRLIGLTMALQQHLAQGGELTGGWAQADEVIEKSIARIKELQNNNGTLSTNWLERSGVSSEVALRLGCTGHQLEFLTLALSDEQLQEPWVKRAVASLCELFEETKTQALECGALYHAAHGLDLYRQRVYGPLERVDDDVDIEALPTLPARQGGPPPPPAVEEAADAEPAVESEPAAEEPAAPPAEAADEAADEDSTDAPPAPPAA